MWFMIKRTEKKKKTKRKKIGKLAHLCVVVVTSSDKSSLSESGPLYGNQAKQAGFAPLLAKRSCDIVAPIVANHATDAVNIPT